MCFMVIVFLAVLSAPSLLAAQAVEIRFNSSQPQGVPPSTGWQWFGEELEKRSNGKIKFSFSPRGLFLEFPMPMKTSPQAQPIWQTPA
jgi:TRAP-type C4-dicarboxylate transport system substrate-binding protein